MSLQNTLFTKLVLPALGTKRRLADAERTRRQIADNALRPARFAPPGSLDRSATVALRRHEGWPVYELSPRSAAPAGHVFYLHGGAYIGEIVRAHWSMLGHVVKEAPIHCVVPIYPLGAALGAAGTVGTATQIARDLIDRAGAENVVLMGDSAGGGMALAVAQALRDQGLTPSRLVLISPWLDVTTDHPSQRAIAPRDAMLAIPGLVEAGRAYAGDLPLDDPRVSPIRGDMHDLPPITAFSGTADLLNPDSHELRDACGRAGTLCELIEAPDMPHAYPLLATPEGRAARRHIIELLRSAGPVITGQPGAGARGPGGANRIG